VRRLREQVERPRAHGLSLSAQYLLSDGVAVGFAASWTNQAFDDSDPFVSVTTAERDNSLGLGIGLMVTAREMLDLAGVDDPLPFADNLVLNLGGRYRRVFSNLENFEYQNFRFELSVTKRFLF